MNKRKQTLAVLGVLSVLFASFAMLVYAATWTPDDMAAYMQNVGRHKIYQTNWILYNQIGPKVDEIHTDVNYIDFYIDPKLDDIADDAFDAMTAASLTLGLAGNTHGWTSISQALDDIKDELEGECDPGVWNTTGIGWTDSYVYNALGIPKKFSFWINLDDLGGVDEVVFIIKYETKTPIMEEVETRTFTGPQDNDSVLLVDQLPIATRVAVTIEQTAGSTGNEIKYHAIIEEN